MRDRAIGDQSVDFVDEVREKFKENNVPEDQVIKIITPFNVSENIADLIDGREPEKNEYDALQVDSRLLDKQEVASINKELLTSSMLNSLDRDKDTVMKYLAASVPNVNDEVQGIISEFYDKVREWYPILLEAMNK